MLVLMHDMMMNDASTYYVDTYYAGSKRWQLSSAALVLSSGSESGELVAAAVLRRAVFTSRVRVGTSTSFRFCRAGSVSGLRCGFIFVSVKGCCKPVDLPVLAFLVGNGFITFSIECV